MKDGGAAEGAIEPIDSTPRTDADSFTVDIGQRVRAALDAIVVLGEEMTVRGRLQRAVELAPLIVDARWGAVAIRAADQSIQTWLCNTADQAEKDWLTATLSALSPADRDQGTHATTGGAKPTQEPPLTLTVLSVPLEATTGVAAELFVARPLTEGELGPAALDVLQGFARVASLGVSNAAQYEQSRQRAGWLQASAQISRELVASAQDETDVWQHVVNTIHRLTDARTVTLVTPSEDSDDQLDIRVATGLGADQLAGRSYPRPGSLTEQVMTTGSIQAVHSSRYRISHADVAPEVPLGAVLALPLRGQDHQPRAAILVSRTTDQPPFSLTDVQLAEDFANQAAIALELAETRTAQHSLEQRELLGQITDTYQDRIIQRLYSIGLRLETASAQHEKPPPSWLTDTIADLGITITEARTSLADTLNRPALDHQRS